MKFGAIVIVYCVIAIIVHILFIVFAFSQRPIDCIPSNRKDPISNEFELFLVWGIMYFPFLIVCALYTLLFRMSRSFLCSCWQCCGNDIYTKGATKCKICFEGIFGNPLIFAIIFTIWGIIEFTSFDNTCSFEIQYGYLADLCIVGISLILLCIYYFVRVKRKMERKRNANIAKKYNEQHHENAKIAAEYNRNGRAHDVAMAENQHYVIQGRQGSENAEGSGMPQQRQQQQQRRQNRRYSEQPMPNRNGLAPQRPQYAASAHGVAPYSPGI